MPGSRRRAARSRPKTLDPGVPCGRVIGEDALDECVEKAGVGEPALFFHWQLRKLAYQRLREETPPWRSGHALPIEYRYVLEPAARGVALQDVAAQALAAQVRDTPANDVFHRRRHVASACHRDESNDSIYPRQPHRLARCAEAGLDFRTNRNPFDGGAKGIDEDLRPLVAPVVADFFAEKAGRDAKADWQRHVVSAFRRTLDALDCAAVIRPMQNGLSLPPAAVEIASLAIADDLCHVPPDRPPSPDLPRVVG